MSTRNDQKIRGWEWVAANLRESIANVRRERERLLGPDRGE